MPTFWSLQKNLSSWTLISHRQFVFFPRDQRGKRTPASEPVKLEPHEIWAWTWICLRNPRKNKKYSQKGLLVRPKIKNHLKQNQVNNENGWDFQAMCSPRDRSSWEILSPSRCVVRFTCLFWPIAMVNTIGFCTLGIQNDRLTSSY